MATITLAAIIDAIESTLGAATTVARSQSYDELTEGLPPGDLPLLQVYWEEMAPVSLGSETDRMTFGGRGGVEATPTRVKEFIFHADYYARQRSHMGEDMAALVDGIDAMIAVLETINTQPYFGLDGIKSFNWYPRRVIFDYGDPRLRYVGARFVIAVRVY